MQSCRDFERCRGPDYSDQAVDKEEVARSTKAITWKFSWALIAIHRFIEGWKDSLIAIHRFIEERKDSFAFERSILGDDHGCWFHAHAWVMVHVVLGQT